MRLKRFIYSVLLILFSLVLVADLAVWFLVPEVATVSEPEISGSFPQGMSFPSDGSFPSGDSLPEGMSFPEGMSLPEGFSAPEGISFPEGMTFPGSPSGDSSESSDSRRPRRSSESSEETTATAAETAEATGFAAILARLLPAAQAMRPYRLYILIGAVLGMALCIIRLVFLNKKLRQLQAQEEAEEAAVSLKRVALWPAFLLLLGALVLVVILFPVNEEEEAEDGAVADVRLLSGTVESKALTSLIQSAGSLEEQEAESLTIPTSVTVSSVCVKNGDDVTAGQIVAKVDKVSVMKAIVSVHEALEQIDSQLQKAHDAKGDTSLTSPVKGTVKAVYAQVGQKAIDVMNEYGALMLLSLDGRMAVQVPAADGLILGAQVTVTLSDGQELAGEVEYLEEGVATVTVADRGYAIGEQVSVKTAEGALLGSGSLYVHKPYRISGYLGTVTRIYRKEGGATYAGVTLISLSDTSDLAEYQGLLQQRSEYEEELRTLFELYQTGYVHAPCDGVIDGLSDDLAYASLSAMVNDLTVQFASTTYWDNEPVPSLSVGTVKGVQADTLLVETAGQQIIFYLTESSIIEYTNDFPYEEQDQKILEGDQILFIVDDQDKVVIAYITHTENSTLGEEGGQGQGGQGDDPNQGQGGQGQGQGNGQDQNEMPSGGSGSRPNGFSGGGWSGGSGIRVPSSGSGSSASSTKKPAYTIAEQELCTVTSQDKMLITVSIDELDILSLSLGQTADLYLDAHPTRGFTATITEIADEGENDGGNTKFSVTLAVDREADLYPGMNGTVCFPRSEGKEVLTVPLAALEEKGTTTQVYTAYDQETDTLLAPVEVQTGISDGTDVVILSGLSLGDTYYYRFADSISYVTE